MTFREPCRFYYQAQQVRGPFLSNQNVNKRPVCVVRSKTKTTHKQQVRVQVQVFNSEVSIYVLLQLGLADVREAEGKQRLPGSDVEHVVLLAEQQRGVIEDTIHRESLGQPLLRI